MAKKKGKKSARPKATKPAAARNKPVKTAKTPPKAVAARNAGGAAGVFETIAQFFREVKTELKKVTWPSRKQTISSTGVVLVLVILVAIFLGGVDFILSWLLKQVLGLGA